MRRIVCMAIEDLPVAHVLSKRLVCVKCSRPVWVSYSIADELDEAICSRCFDQEIENGATIVIGPPTEKQIEEIRAQKGNN